MRAPTLFFPSPSHRERRAFTLIELLVVIGIMALASALLVPAFTNLKAAGNITNAAYAVVGVLEQGRNYAMAHNTYVWVGFYEESAASAVPTNATPAYPGRGRLILATVASADGTKIFDNADPIASLPGTRIKQIGKISKIEGLHVTDVGAPPSPSPASATANTFESRPDGPYTEGAPFTHFNRISSDSPDATRFSFSVQDYTFYKTVRFNPRGEANLNSTYALKHAAEIGLRPSRQEVVDMKSRNLIAIQFNGVSGNFRIYRQ